MTRYEQTVRLIQQYMADHDLRPGDRLPPETELAKLAGVSLITVRRAMAELASRGMVRREQGRGTFVQATLIDAETTRLGSLRETLGGDHLLETVLVGITRRRANPQERALLDLARGDMVWEVLRLRTIDREPMIFEIARVPVVRAPLLDSDLAQDGSASLYRLLAQTYGLEEAYEEQTLTVETADSRARQYLHVREGQHVVVLSGVSYAVGSVPFDAFRLTFRADRFAFHLRSTPQSTLVALAATGSGPEHRGADTEWSADP